MISQYEALDLLKRENVEPHVVRHILAVNSVSNYIAKELAQRGIDIDLHLVDVGSLLHDVGRGRSHKGHTKIGAEIMRGYGEYDIARLIDSHSMDCFTDSYAIEDKIVHYSDKRVQHDGVVSLSTRMSDLVKRYPHHADNLNEIWPKLKGFEKYVFGIIGEEKRSLESLKK